MTIMSDEIADAIKKNLSQSIGEALQAELAELERLRKLEVEYKKLMDIKIKLQADYAVATTALNKHIEMDAKLEALAVRERDLRVIIAEFKQGAAEQRAMDIKELVSLVFRNPVTTRVMSGSLPGGVVPGMNGNQAYSSSVPVNTTESETTS